jgi:hypothetical protein
MSNNLRFLFFLLSLFSNKQLFAQQIKGNVIDSLGALIEGATVGAA